MNSSSLMDRKQLAKKIYDLAHLTGSFKLRSGQISSYYFDKYRFEASPLVLKAIAQSMVPLIPAGTEVLAGLEMGGIPIATALSLECGLPVVFVRKEAKSYGTCQFAEGGEINGKRVCIIEDVITTGGQVISSTQDLRQLGAQINDVMCVILRGENIQNLSDAGLHLHPLFNMNELLQAGEGK